MVDTVRTLAALQALLADNTAGDISAQDVRDFLVSVYPSFETYTPTWTAFTTNPVIGNGTINGYYRVLGTGTQVWVEGFVRILMGSTTTYGTPQWWVGVPAGLTPAFDEVVGGTIICSDTGSAVRGGTIYVRTAGHFEAYADGNTTTRVGPTNPHTWAATDVYSLSFGYVHIP